MTTECRQFFQDLTAWFSDSVVNKRKIQWKRMGGKEASFATAQFIFSENATSTDTEQIFQSEAYRDEHIAVFHAKYISDTYKSSKNLPVGKYFLPPKEIQRLVSKQMKFIWDDIDSGVSSDEESSPIKDNQETSQKRTHSNQTHSIDNQIYDKQRQNNKTSDNSIPSTSKGQQNAAKSVDLSVNMGTRLATTPSKGQNQGQNLNKSTDLSQKRHLNKNSTNLSPSESKKSKTNDHELSYSLRKRSDKNYSELGDIDVDGIVLDNTESITPQNRHSITDDRVKDSYKDYFCVEDLPKVTSEMDDLILGRNGFEVMFKK